MTMNQNLTWKEIRGLTSALQAQAANMPGAGVSLSGGGGPDEGKAIARAQGTHVFNHGEPAVLLYKHKDRVFNVPVKVVRAAWMGPVTKSGEVSSRAPDAIKYTVMSENGGTMCVGAPSLRPGNVLDRISIALELDER